MNDLQYAIKEYKEKGDGNKFIKQCDMFLHYLINKEIKNKGRLCSVFSYEDAMQEAYIALLEAAENYNESTDALFSAYAYKYISMYVLEKYLELRNHLHVAKKSRSSYNDEDIISYAEYNEVDNLQDLHHSNYYEIEEDIFFDCSKEDILKIMENSLDKKQMDVILKSFGLDGEPKTPQQIANEYGYISSITIRQIKLKAFRLIRHYLVKLGIYHQFSEYLMR